jgi:hypothetical protein
MGNQGRQEIRSGGGNRLGGILRKTVLKDGYQAFMVSS